MIWQAYASWAKTWAHSTSTQACIEFLAVAEGATRPPRHAEFPSVRDGTTELERIYPSKKAFKVRKIGYDFCTPALACYSSKEMTLMKCFLSLLSRPNQEVRDGNWIQISHCSLLRSPQTHAESHEAPRPHLETMVLNPVLLVS